MNAPSIFSPITIESATFTSIEAIWPVTCLIGEADYLQEDGDICKPRHKLDPGLWNPRLVSTSFRPCEVSVINTQALTLSKYCPDDPKLYK